MRLTEEQFLAIAKKNKQQRKPTKTVMPDAYTSNFKGWVEVAPEKNYYFKSRYEVYYAKYLEFLKRKGEILDWHYEPKTFNFPKEEYATGPFTYKPDFKVILKNETSEWHEVKGWLNPSSKKKIKRFHKHFPDEGEITIIGKEFFKKLRKQGMSSLLGWDAFKAQA